ncbi:transducin beta-like protein 2 [Hordeum vulgare]|nr:transducin beta-like protein 2 [Hordeum vulgare]
MPILSALLGGAVVLVFLAGYLHRKHDDIAHVPPLPSPSRRTSPSRSAPPMDRSYPLLLVAGLLAALLPAVAATFGP